MANKKSVENRVYASVVLHCEEMENKGQYKGNGHHLAQRLSSMVTVGLLSKQQRQIYDALTESQDGISVKEISLATKIQSRAVSAQLRAINSNTQLINFKKIKKDGKIKLWYKYKIQ